MRDTRGLFIVILALEVFVASYTCSQEPPATSNALEEASSQNQHPASSEPGSLQNKNDKDGKGRIFGIFPAFNISEQANPAPLTSGQKFKLFARSTYDPVTLIAPALKVPILQAVEGDSGFGTGFEGFAKRYGVALADGTSSRFFRQFFFPSVLKEDPRFFRREEGSFGSRLGYSLSRLFVTRTDSGRDRFGWSKLLGTSASSSLANAYYPESQRGKRASLLNFGLSYLSEAGANVVKEFSPDISRKFRKKKSPEPSPASIPSN